MKIWIYLNGRQEGPYSLEELADKPIDENTKVWFDGLPKWYPAGTLTELRPLFDGSSLEVAEKDEKTDVSDDMHASASSEVTDETETAGGVEETVIDETLVDEPKRKRFAPGQRSYVAAAKLPDEPCPPTYIGWSVALAICCCSPVSIAALIASICVSTSYNSGRLERAKRASDIAVWLVMASFALGMIPVILTSLLLGN